MTAIAPRRGGLRQHLADLKTALEAADAELPNQELIRRDPACAAVPRAAEEFLAALRM